MARTALLVIDVQAGLMPYMAHSEKVLQAIADLLGQARLAGTPVIYVQHEETDGLLVADTPAWEIHHAVAPRAGESIVHKRACDAFHETSLHDELQERGIGHLVITGCQTDFCVDTTCRRAVTMGYDVTLVKNAHSTEDGETLTADQIIAHHNRVLNGFGTEQHRIRVRPAAEITL
ncbi:MAG: cysteine hydrolase family protein [Mycobacterium leprae]